MKFLIHEPPLQLLPSLAVAIGLNEAIVLQQVHYWLNNPKAGVEKDGQKWIFNTYEQWRENFPFWSDKTIQRTFLSLEAKKLIITAQFNIKDRDATKFYRIDYGQLETLEEVKLSSSMRTHSPDVNRNTETTAENTTEIAPTARPLDLVDGILELQVKPLGIRKAIAENFKLTPNWEAKYNRQFLEWSVESHITAQQIARAASCWRSDKRFNWAAPTLRGIQEHWIELIQEETHEEIYELPKDPNEGLYVPAPATGPNIPRGGSPWGARGKG